MKSWCPGLISRPGNRIGIGSDRLRSRWRLSILLPAEQNVEQSWWIRRRGAGRHFVMRPPRRATPNFVLRFCGLRFPCRRCAFFLVRHGQLGGRGLPDFDWNADGRRFARSAGLFRLGIASFAGQACDLGLLRRRFRTNRCVRQVAQTSEFGRPLKRCEDKELTDFRMALVIEQCSAGGRYRCGQRSTRPVRRAQRQDQDQYGEKHAANWKNAENRGGINCA